MDPNRFKFHGKSVSLIYWGFEMNCHVSNSFWFDLVAGGTDAFNRSHVTLKPDEDNIEDAILVIEHAVLEDRESYNCTATNPATNFNSTIYPPATDSSYVRVKGILSTMVIDISWLTTEWRISHHYRFFQNRQISSVVAVLGNLRGSVCFMCHYLSVWEATQQGRLGRKWHRPKSRTVRIASLTHCPSTESIETTEF